MMGATDLRDALSYIFGVEGALEIEAAVHLK
jgi:hypothetical protein